MDGSFTVFHNGQFWVGVLEIAGEDGVRAAQHVFGPEPTNAELLEFARGGGYDELSERAHAAPPVPAERRAEQRAEQRRTARRAAKLAAREQDQVGIGTAAQRALKEQLAQRRAASARARKQDRVAAAEHRRQRAAAKAKARHRGKA